MLQNLSMLGYDTHDNRCYGYGLNMKKWNTDHDGINDGDELHYWNVTRGLPLNKSIAYCKNPDVDNDSIPDGKEIKGYTAKIITDWDSKGTPISEKRFISPNELDPLIPYGYNASDGFHWSDTDGDHIPDAVESMLNNASQFLEFYNFTHCDDWMKDYRIALWNDYEWSIAYYYALKSHKSWDVVNEQLDAVPISHIKNYPQDGVDENGMAT